MSPPPALARIATAALVSLAGCKYSQLPQTPCPDPPAPADWGPLAPMAGSSSVDIELNRLYVFARVRDLLEGSQTGDAGAFVRSVDLREISGQSGGTLSTLAVQLEPWVRDTQSGQPLPLGRFYRVTLKITPHLITPASVPDETRRRRLLCPANDPDCGRDRGASLTFDLHELTPACDPADFVDARIRPKLYEALARQRPLVLPTAPVSAVLDSVTGDTARLADVNVSADGLLKLGLLYEIDGVPQASHAFDRATQLLSRYPQNDWLVSVEPAIMAAGLRSRVERTLAKRAEGSSVDPNRFEARFLPDEIEVSGVALLPVPGICGTTAEVSFQVRNPTRVCRGGDGRSRIVGYPETEVSSGNFCVSLAMFFSSLNVGTVSGPPVGEWPLIARVSFAAGERDTFYGTRLDLDDAFGLVGRSSFMDRVVAGAGTPRTVAPERCPGVP
jgi:hypothetical protein